MSPFFETNPALRTDSRIKLGQQRVFRFPFQGHKPTSAQNMETGELPKPWLGLRVENQTEFHYLLGAFRLGYRSIYADGGQQSEMTAGAALREALIRWGLKREDFFVAACIARSGLGYDQTLKSIENTLFRLGLGYLDLCLIKSPGSDSSKGLAEACQALVRLRDEGRVRLLGLDNFSLEETEQLLRAGFKPAVSQVLLHPHFQQKELCRLLARHKVRIEAGAPLGGGSAVFDPLFRKMTLKYHKTPAQIILRWHLECGRSVITGVVKPEHIMENFDIFDFHLDPEDMRQIALLNKAW